MSDITLDYLIKHYKINNYLSTGISDKYINNVTFINKIKNKKIISYSNNGIFDDCYPNYLYSDSTVIKIDNSIIGNFENLNDIIYNLDIKNNFSTSFIRENKITDLSYIKRMSNNSSQKKSLLYKKNSDLNKKFIDSILISENSMNLITLSYLDHDIIFDNDINKITNIIEYVQENFLDQTTILTNYTKPLIGENNFILDISFNKDSESSPVFGSLYRYRDIEILPNFTGQYKIKLNEYVNYSTNEYLEQNNFIGTFSKFVVYPNKDIDSYVVGSNDSRYSTSEYFYLIKNQPYKIHIACKYSELEINDTTPYVNLNITAMDDSEILQLMQINFSFERNNNPITSYYYLGNEYDVTTLLDKMDVRILNIQTHLILFDTKDTFFEEHEKYAINNYCNIKLKFVNSENPLYYKQITKPIEVRE